MSIPRKLTSHNLIPQMTADYKNMNDLQIIVTSSSDSDI